METIEHDQHPPESTQVAIRLILTVVLIGVALGDLATLHWDPKLFWPYSQVMVIVDVLVAMIFVGFVPLGPFCTRWSLVWRQSLHWLGFLVLVYLVHDLLFLGVLTHRTAGLSLLGLSGFVLYFAGLYVDLLMMLAGVVCISMAASMIWLHHHFWLLVLPLCVLALLLVILSVRNRE